MRKNKTSGFAQFGLKSKPSLLSLRAFFSRWLPLLIVLISAGLIALNPSLARGARQSQAAS
jgi:hypothetical protein